MNALLKHALVSAAVLLTAASAAVQASPVVAVGGTYDFTVFGTGSGLTAETFTFDGQAETFGRTTSDGTTTTLTLTESQQDLGGGLHRIVFDLLSTGELYPAQDEDALVAMGALGNPLDLLRSVRLDSAFVRFYDMNGAQQAMASFFLPQGDGPWNGAFLDDLQAGGVSDFGGRDTRGARLELFVSEVPEPHTAALAGVALLGLFAARRRGR